MMMLAPNLTTIVGELVGAKLIAASGSLINLAKYPSSTLQILGAEKALFQALKKRKDTPKYGILFHASMVGQASTKIKGNVSRSLAAKCSLATRIDALGSNQNESNFGIDFRGKIEKRVSWLEQNKKSDVNRKKFDMDRDNNLKRPRTNDNFRDNPRKFGRKD